MVSVRDKILDLSVDGSTCSWSHDEVLVRMKHDDQKLEEMDERQ